MIHSLYNFYEKNDRIPAMKKKYIITQITTLKLPEISVHIFYRYLKI